MKLKDIERDHIVEVLKSTNWRLGGAGGAAELLGLKRTTLHEKIKINSNVNILTPRQYIDIFFAGSLFTKKLLKSKKPL